MRRVLLLLWLTVLWVMLWRDITLANIIGGFILAAVVIVIYPMAGRRDPALTVRPWRLVVFLSYFLAQLVISNVAVARAIMSPRDHIRTGILAVPLTGASDLITTVVGNALSLTPGSLTIEVGHNPRTIYVHTLHIYDIEKVRDNVHKMARMALRAVASEPVLQEFDRAVAEGARPAAAVPGREGTV